MSSGRPRSETGRKSTMADVTGDASTVPNLTAMKRGGGFRSSFSGRVATVFGCSGGLGRVVCNRLGKQGTQMILPYRGDHYQVMRMKVCGDLGQVLFTEYNLKDEESIKTAMKYSDIVINLVGREYETRNFTFDDVHNKGARLLAKCARESGVKNFIHISHINASEDPQTIWSRGSDHLKSKWKGEIAVREEFPDATIFRPVEMIGTGDWFVQYYVSRVRTGIRRSVPLWKKGRYTVKQPLSIKNMGDAIMAALDDPSAMGKTYEAMGPERYLLSDLMDWMHEIMDKSCPEWGYRRTDLRLDILPFFKAYLLQKIRLGQKWQRGHTIERLERTQLTEESRGLPNITDLGVNLESIQDDMAWVLDPHRAFRYHYYHTWVEKPVIHPLVPLTRIEEARIRSEDEQMQSMLKVFGV